MGSPYGALSALGNNSLAMALHAQQMQAQAFLAQVTANTLALRPLPRWMRPDPKQPDTMGWRSWVWHAGDEMLVSPHQMTAWPEAKLIAERWSDDDALRGAAGIHARLVPKHWKIIGWPDDESSAGLEDKPELVTGIVERFGRYVIGTQGWRAEQVVIRELMAPSTEIGLKLEALYPDVIVHYPDQIEEGETPCKSEKSFVLEKGSRSLLPSTQPAPSPVVRIVPTYSHLPSQRPSLLPIPSLPSAKPSPPSLSPYSYWRPIFRAGFWPAKVVKIKYRDDISWKEVTRRFHRWVWYGGENV